MDKLWAPWRIKYVAALKKTKQCIFCRAAKSAKAKYVVFATKHSLCMLNIFPYNNGHLMVASRKHKADLLQLSEEESIDLFRALKRAKKLLDKTLKPNGYNIGINLFSAAGAGITGHLHIHIVPRWKGDTNFMPVACSTKIISQSLEELFKILKNAQSDID